MFHLGSLITTFLIVLLAELGDKTQLVAFSLTTTTRRPVIVFAATSLALALSSVLASLLGRAAAEIIPRYTSYISAGLFICFGIYILASKEPNALEEVFLRIISVKKSCINMIKKTDFSRFRGIEKIRGEEESQYQAFRLLLKEKHLFRDYGDNGKAPEKLLSRLKPCSYSRNQRPEEAVKQLIEHEKVSIEFYRTLLRCLDTNHPESGETGPFLRRMLIEERRHLEFYKKLYEEMNEDC